MVLRAQPVAFVNAHRTSGVVAASLTPLDAELNADVKRLSAHCRGLLDAGCADVVILGTTGEANSFTVGERERILEGVIAFGLPAARIIAGTGCCAAGDTVRLTKHALALGVDRVLMLPPFYYKGVSEQGVLAAYERVIDAVADSRLRVYLYLIPQFSGIDISERVIARLVDRFGGSIAGLKDSAGTWSRTEALCKRFGARMDVLVGNERFMVEALAAGAAGCVTATANVAAPLIRALYDNAAREGARELERSVAAVRSAFEGFPLVAALKAFFWRQSGDERWRGVRPPLTALSPQEADILYESVSAGNWAFQG